MKKIQIALIEAITKNIPVKFEDWDESETQETGYKASRVGTALPCGCIEYTTILSDGSLGWGGWTDSCWDHMNS